MSRVGLILEGGGMRGLYTAGVLDFFLDAKIEFEDVMGVSAGACNAISYLSKQKGRNLQVNTEYLGDKRYLSWRNMIKTGSLFGMDFIFKEIPDYLVPFNYENYYSSESEFTVVATNCETGQAEYLNGKEPERINDYLRASSSIPMFAPVVHIEDKKLLDGGVADSIPLEYSINKGNDKHVIVLTRNKDYVKQPEVLKKVYTRQYKKYPKLVEAMDCRHEAYNQTLEAIKQLEQEGKVLVIRPSKPVTIGRFEKDVEKLTALYNNGYEDAKSMYEALKEMNKVCENMKIED